MFEHVVEGYTSESGVRGLDKKLAKLVRYAAKSIAMGESYESELDKDSIVEILGANRFSKD